MEGSAPSAAPAGGGDTNASGESTAAGNDTAPGASKDASPNKQGVGAAEKKASESADGEGKEGTTPKAEPKAAEKAPVRRYKLPTDDGGEEEVDEAEVKRRIVHAREANKRMEKAATTEKKMQEFIEHLTSDPVGVLERLAAQNRLKVNHIEAMEQRLNQHYKRQLMTPEQIQAEKDQADAEAFRAWQTQQQEQAQQQQVTAAQKHFEDEYEKKILGALEPSGLPKTPGTVKRVAGLMELAIKKGYEPDLNLIVDIVRKDYHGETKALYGNLDGDQLLAVLGEDVANKIRKADLARLKGRFQQETPKEPPKPRQQNSKERLNSRDFFEAAMRRAGMK